MLARQCIEVVKYGIYCAKSLSLGVYTLQHMGLTNSILIGLCS